MKTLASFRAHLNFKTSIITVGVSRRPLKMINLHFHASICVLIAFIRDFVFSYLLFTAFHPVFAT